jgi:hypothetical protein
MALMSLTAGVSFVRTPVAKVTERAAAIEALGWREVGRGDPWVVSFQKDVPEEDSDPSAELREAMGEFWVTADEIRELLNRP